MKTITITEFRKRASRILSDVEEGEHFLVLRHGKPVAEISPAPKGHRMNLSWKRPGLRLTTKGASLSAAILEERECDNGRQLPTRRK